MKLEIHEILGHAANYECLIKRSTQSESWICEFPDLPGCIAVGYSRANAVELGEKSLSAWLAKAVQIGMKIPEPGGGRNATGEIKIRIAKGVHRRLSQAANLVNVSLNELVVRLLCVAVSRMMSIDPSAKNFGIECLIDDAQNSDSKKLPTKNMDREFSGVWVQRLPRALHMQLQNLADLEETSLNGLVTTVVASELGRLEKIFEDREGIKTTKVKSAA
jgi:predicted HicB family RNase H-like nuclease